MQATFILGCDHLVGWTHILDVFDGHDLGVIGALFLDNISIVQFVCRERFDIGIGLQRRVIDKNSISSRSTSFIVRIFRWASMAKAVSSTASRRMDFCIRRTLQPALLIFFIIPRMY
jgi:hypothetical protein